MPDLNSKGRGTVAGTIDEVPMIYTLPWQTDIRLYPERDELRLAAWPDYESAQDRLVLWMSRTGLNEGLQSADVTLTRAWIGLGTNQCQWKTSEGILTLETASGSLSGPGVRGSFSSTAPLSHGVNCELDERTVSASFVPALCWDLD
jgi:hypothetical protein